LGVLAPFRIYRETLRPLHRTATLLHEIETSAAVFRFNSGYGSGPSHIPFPDQQAADHPRHDDIALQGLFSSARRSTLSTTRPAAADRSWW
jgi:hypothetical protein